MNLNPKQSIALAFAMLLVILFAAPTSAAEDRTSYAHTVVVGANETVDDIVCFMCSVIVRGAVQGDIVTIGGNIEIEGTVTRDAVAAGGDVHIGPSAILKGEAIAFGGSVTRDSRAGSNEGDESFPWFSVPGQRAPHWRGALGLFGFHALIALIFGAILRGRRLRNIGSTLTDRPVVAFLTGIGIFLLAVVLFYAGSWLGRWEGDADWIIAALLSIVLGLGWVGIACSLGKMFVLQNTAGAVAIGAASITILELIPFVGLVVFLLLLLLGPGAAVLSGFGNRNRDAAPPVSGPEPAALSPQS